jgi:lipopolysaccharide/colanic/teichoic acid biosynthesis glycosyltransferase
MILAAPLMLLIALCIRATMGRPVLFRQIRPGLNGRPFVLYKFRSMRIEESTGPARDGYRITPTGRFLRRTSLDELPEFWNVLCGHMSLVGPRPLLMQYLDRYSPEQRRRQEVLPGITGWAQVNGRNAVDWDQRFVMDVWYVDHQSLWLDLKILSLTFLCLLRPQGINRSNHTTMPEFMGMVQNEKAQM